MNAISELINNLEYYNLFHLSFYVGTRIILLFVQSQIQVVLPVKLVQFKVKYPKYPCYVILEKILFLLDSLFFKLDIS